MKRLHVFSCAALVCAVGIGVSVHAADAAKAGKTAVLNSLKDPDSARFRNTSVNGATYCGEVNAKNSYGGYVGFKRFVAIGSAALVEPAEDLQAFETFWRESCWPKGKLDAYRKKQQEIDALSAQINEQEKQRHDSVVRQTIEQQQEELRKLAEEQERKKSE
jgi:hypothetical protein